MEIIDLRSDTVTKPSQNMLNYMMGAELGDDVYAEDPTVNLLQSKVAELFAKDDALFVPSGTMSNQIALKILTNPGDEVIAEKEAHIFYYETAAPSILSNIQIRTIPSYNGMIPLEEIEKAIRPNDYYFPTTKVIALENTHNRHGGAILDLNYIKDVRRIADKYDLMMHLDGARIWNATVASGVPLMEYAKYFDTLSVCLSKGMGAPVGSLLMSTKENIKKAIKWRKIFGGGMRQAGILAAAGIYAIDNNYDKLTNDHQNAKQFANLISKIDRIDCDIDRVQTNIVIFALHNTISPSSFVAKCKQKGLLLSAVGEQNIRVVFHLNISDDNMYSSIDIIESIIKEL